MRACMFNEGAIQTILGLSISMYLDVSPHVVTSVLPSLPSAAFSFFRRKIDETGVTDAHQQETPLARD